MHVANFKYKLNYYRNLSSYCIITQEIMLQELHNLLIELIEYLILILNGN